MNYYYKSEFELIESFLDAAGDPVDITNIDIEIVYYTSGWERYTVSRIGGVPVNCVFSEAEPTKLTVVFQNHGLKEGALRREITLFVDNINFTSGKQKVALAPLTSENTIVSYNDSEVVAEDIIITEFSQPDIAGKQYILKTTKIARNKTKQNRLSKIDNSKQTIETKQSEQKTDNTSIKTNENTKKQTTTVTKTKTPGWVYPVSILIALGLLFLIYLLLKRYKIL